MTHVVRMVPLDDELAKLVEPLVLYIDPGSASEELLTEFFVTLSTLYRSMGGSGLKVESISR